MTPPQSPPSFQSQLLRQARRLGDQLFEQLQAYRLVLNDDQVSFCEASQDAPYSIPAGTPPEVEAVGFECLRTLCEDLDDLVY